MPLPTDDPSLSPAASGDSNRLPPIRAGWLGGRRHDGRLPLEVTPVATRHVYRGGNQWGMTVAELPEAAVAEGRPLALDWDKDGKTWDRPGNRFHAVVMPAITEDTELIAAATKHDKKDRP